MSPADESPLHTGFVPMAEMRISSTDALRAISDPTRMRILEAMVQRQDPPWSVKEVAAALGVPQTRLYHHVDQLLAHGLIRAVEQRVVSGIIETRYRAAALSFQLDRRLFTGGDDAGAILHDTLVTVFDTARDEIEAAMRSADPDQIATDGQPQMTLSRSIARLSPARAGVLHARLAALVAEFGDEEDPDGHPVGLVVAAYRLPPTLKEPSDG
jgi:DNA-binding transcriptional ArsR family regulator